MASKTAAAANAYKSYKEVASTLPSVPGPCSLSPSFFYQGCWIPKFFVTAVIAAQHHFVARPTDLFLCTFPKSGTTWLKALMFCIITRADYPDLADHPLLRANPHSWVRFLEEIYADEGGMLLDADEPCSSPRLFATHIPYSILPESIKRSIGCRIVYLCREPKDTLISCWKFLMGVDGKDHVDVEEYMEWHLRGEGYFGPLWDHMLGYRRESKANPNKVLFLKYEEMKKDGEGMLRRLANFMGYPFSPKEDEDGVVQRIVELCSFGSLSKLDVNTNGKWPNTLGVEVANNLFFRKGEVGDWANYLTPEMAKRIDDTVEAKLHGSGLTFNDRGGF